MQNEVIAKIDALVKMSDSSSSINTLKVELRELECTIKEKKLELKELQSSITDDKYFDASGEIVDKNIEIFLSKKIKTMMKSLADLENQVSKVALDEAKYNSELESIRKEIEESEQFLDVLNIKTSSANENDNFKTLYEETESKLKNIKKELSKKEKSYEKIQGKLEVLTFAKNELKNKIDSESEKLIDVKANLLNKRGYVNAELKQEDEDAIAKLEKEIAELNEEKAKISSDPAMLAEDAKMYLVDDDKTEALKKIQKLRDILLEQPYMDVTSNKVDTLIVELENAEAKRDEFASMIHSKNYESVDTTLIKDRISYIKDKKEKLEKEIKNIKSKIEELDSKDLEDLNNRINYCENEVESLKEKIEEYEETLSSDEIVISKRAALQASFDKKQEELENILELLSAYREDRKNIITKSYNLEEENIRNIKEEIKEIDEEIRKLEKLSVSTVKTKDTIAIENDKKTLKELNENIKAIKKRQDLKTSPSELYDEIEMLLGIGNNSNFEVEEVEDEEEPVLEIEPTIENEIEPEELEEKIETSEEEEQANEESDELELNDIEEIPTIDIEPIEFDNIEPIEVELNNSVDIEPVEINLDEINLDNEAQNNEIESDIIDLDSLHPIDDEEIIVANENDANESEEKIKVVNIEPLDDGNSTNEIDNYIV